MLQKKDAKMLIAKYHAENTFLEEMEEYLTRRTEILGNLIPLVLMWFVWRVSQTNREVPFPQHESEGEARAKVQGLENVLEQLQQADRRLKEEEKVIKKRIVDMEVTMADNSNEYVAKTMNTRIQRLGVPKSLGTNQEEETDEHKPERMEDQKSEDLFHTENTENCNVCVNLLKRVSELSEKLKKYSRKLEESENYYKFFVEKCSKLEKELKEEIDLLRKRTFRSMSKVDEQGEEKMLQRESGSTKALAAMKKALAKVRSMKEELSTSSMFGEKDDVDSEDDKVSSDLSKTVPQGTDKVPEVLDTALKGLSAKWRNWVIRGIFTFLMIGAFCLIIYGGPLALMVTTLIVQVKCFEEIINIGYTVYRIHGLPWFRSLSWYFLIASNYFFYGESLVDYFGVVINQTDYLRVLVTYHRFISFCLYVVGFVWFVLSLVNKYYMKQFSLFAWTHVALLIVVTQSYLIIQNIFEGLIWFIVPVSMVVCNDVWAYLFGFFFGRTPLIKLSPKKTWEGFIGGGFATVIFGLLVSYLMCQYKYFVCPIEFSEKLGRMTMECEPSPLFRLQDLHLPETLQNALAFFGYEGTIRIYPFMYHSLSLSVFSSVIGPFGGFFASGFKRAFKIKDFGDVIPGHGGIMDRFDCQYLMATFVNVYISSFIRTSSPQKLLQQVFSLKPEQQLQLFYTLKTALEDRGILTTP